MFRFIFQQVLLLVPLLLSPVFLSAQYSPDELYGSWILKRIDDQVVKTSVATTIEIVEGSVEFKLPMARSDVAAEWILKGDNKTIKINSERGEELWKIELLSEQQLMVFDIKSQQILVFKKIGDYEKKEVELPEEEHLKAPFDKVAVAEQKLLGYWVCRQALGLKVPLSSGELTLLLKENGEVELSLKDSKNEGTWQQVEERKAIAITINDNTSTWWIHQFKSTELHLLEKGIVFIFEKK